MLMHPCEMFVGFVIKEKQTRELPTEKAVTMPLCELTKMNCWLDEDHVPVWSAAPTTFTESC